MEKMKLKIKKLNKDAVIPNYAHPGDAGLDLYSLEDYTLAPSEQRTFFIGFALEFPFGYVALVKDKGGVAKAGVHTLGGVYDTGYRGEYNVTLINLSKDDYNIKKGNKIAQLVILPMAQGEMEITDQLSTTARGEGRFGSTGKK